MLAPARRLTVPSGLALCLLCVVAGDAQGRERFWPGKQRFRQAALGALRHPGTWVPAGGAAVFAAAGWDDNVSEWAVRETPIFGSRRSALDASNDLLVLGNAAMVATAFLEPPAPGRIRKAWKTVAIEEAGFAVTSATTAALKDLTRRERPNASSEDSFPSGHASLAFAAAAASARNVAASRLNRPAQRGLSIALQGVAAGTAWARIEAGVHFPTDVLAGAALGNLVSLLVHDAFLENRQDLQAMLSVDSRRAALTFHWTPAGFRRTKLR